MKEYTSCPVCGSTNIKHHRSRRLKSKMLSVQYKCKECKHFFTDSQGAPSKENLPPTIAVNDTEWSHQSNNQVLVTGRIQQEAGRKPPTLDEVIKKFGIDETIWSVERFVVNEWEQGQSTKDGTPCIISLYQIKLTLVRQVAVETAIPPIQPIHIKVSTPKEKKATKKQFKKAVYLSDAHIGFHRNLRTGQLEPYHNRKHWSAVLSYLRDNPVDLFVLGGDIMDMGDMSDKFTQTPDGHFTTQPALVETAWLIGSILDAIPASSKLVYIEGNHENRLPRFLLNHFSSAFNVSSVRFSEEPILSVPELIVGQGVDQSRIEWVGDYPNGAYWLNNTTRLIHGHISKSRAGATAGAYLDEINASTIFGHIHRHEVASMSLQSRSGQEVETTVFTAQSFGMFGVPSQVPPFKANHNWQQGFGILRYDEAYCSAQTVSLMEEGFEVEGNMYIGEDYTERIVKDTEWLALSSA